MATDEIKEYLATYSWLDTENVKDLKRISKFKNNGYNIRVFENKVTGRQGYVITDENDDVEYSINFWEFGPTVFGVYRSEDNELCVSFAPKSFWEREGCIPDQDYETVMDALFAINDGPYQFDEACENMFYVYKDGEETKDILGVIHYLCSKGLVHDEKLQELLNGGGDF